MASSAPVRLLAAWFVAATAIAVPSRAESAPTTPERDGWQFDATPYFLLPHRSASYHVIDGTPRPAPFDVDTGITVSNGGLNAPLGDMAKYLDFLIGPGREPGLSAFPDSLPRAAFRESARGSSF